MAFLGHIISGKGITVDPQMIDAVKNLPRPLSPLDIRNFFGLASYFRRFVEEFLSLPILYLDSLKKKKFKFEWSKACEKSSQKLKTHYNPSFDFAGRTRWFCGVLDASRIGLDRVLMEQGKVIA